MDATLGTPAPKTIESFCGTPTFNKGNATQLGIAGWTVGLGGGLTGRERLRLWTNGHYTKVTLGST